MTAETYRRDAGASGRDEPKNGDEDAMERRSATGPDPGRKATERSDGGPAFASDAGFGLVEALIAFVILAVGLLAVAGIALSVAAQTRGAAATTAQSLAAQQVLEVTATAEYSAVSVGQQDTTVTVGNRTFTVTRTVEQPTPRTKRVIVEVPGSRDQSDETMITYLHQSTSLPPFPSS